MTFGVVHGDRKRASACGSLTFPLPTVLNGLMAPDSRFSELALPPRVPMCLRVDCPLPTHLIPFGLFAELLLFLTHGAQVPPMKVPLLLPPQPSPNPWSNMLLPSSGLW